jgi:hypothetical protein
MKDELPNLSSLAGEQLSSVIFVADYVQFDFNGPVLSAFSPPIVEVKGVRSQFPGPGSRDALCSLIQQFVASAGAQDNRSIDVSFDSGARLTISLAPDSYDGPEAATFSDPKVGGLLVW